LIYFSKIILDKTMNKSEIKGFTLIELLLVLGVITVLMGLTIVIIRPAEKLAQSRDKRRLSDVETIYGVIEQYVFLNNGELPGGDGECFDSKIPEETFDAIECETYLTPDFLSELPKDPLYGSLENTRYLLKKDTLGIIGVSAEYTEEIESITAGKW
jgi:prepilin-type N-terminal cleavage/methylation domain-containing protein